MKITYHFPTEQYGYVEIEKEVPNPSTESLIQSLTTGTMLESDMLGNYDLIKQIASLEPKTALQQGLEVKVWNSALDRYLTENKVESGLYEQMSPEQQRVMQEIKRSFKRLQAKNNKE